MEENNRTRILQIGCSNFGAGGRTVAIYTLCELFNDSQYDVHYLAHSILANTKKYEQLLEERGWHIDYCKADSDSFIKRQFQMQRSLHTFFINNQFDIVHINADTAWEAMQYIRHMKQSTQKIIVHAHTAGTDAKGWKQIIKKFLYKIAGCYIRNKIDLRLACSNQAAKYLFGEKDAKRALILKNGINFQRFKYNSSKRQSMRKQMGLSKDTLVIGNIGRLAPPKNQFYLLQVFAEMLYLKGDMILLIAGDGPLKEELISKSKSLGIADKVRFLGTRSDTENLYQTMDVFVLTSNYEGFGIVNIEAQASGLPCFISDVVPQSVKINCNVEFLSILEEPKVWAKQILNADLSRVEVTYEEFARSGFDISQTSVQLQEYYQKLLKK